MKKLIAFLLIVISIISCDSENENSVDSPKPVSVAGKVLNYSNEWKNVTLSVNRIGFNQQRMEIPLDEQGNFSASFNSYIPTDVWVSYRNNFLILTHPGDSIYVEFDGSLKDRSAILKTVIFGGDNTKSNQDATAFQRMYFSYPEYTTDSINKVFKKSDIDQFRNYLDSSKIKLDALLQNFNSGFHPNEETKIWTSEFVNNKIYDRIFFYPFFHKSLNNQEYNNYFNEMPPELFSPILKRGSISNSMFISGASVTSYLRYYIGAYKQVNNLYMGKSEAQINSLPRNTLDSLTIFGLLDCSKDILFKQLVLTTLFSERMVMESDIEYFEKYQDVIEKHIQEPFLRNPLWEMYQKNKQKIEDQISDSKIFKNQASNISDEQIIDSIIVSNRGKVIYLDCWATWCGPCKAEMPNSKALMEEMQDKDVVFAFLCLHSDKKEWQSTINKLKIGGQHYFLQKKQSMDFAKFYAINGVPNYMLIDKHGSIVDQGNHLRPNAVKEKIEKLLKE